MNTISQLYFNCEFCEMSSQWEVIELCSTCSKGVQNDPCVGCFYRVIVQHNEKVHYSVDLV